MKWIGLTGGIASGKSTVSRILVEEGWPVVDADLIAKQVVEPGRPGLQLIKENFGKHLMKEDGTLDRRELGKLVFAQPDQLLKLEKLLHPLVQAETVKQRAEFEKQGRAFAFYDVPLLFEKNLEKQFDAIIVVATTEDLQKSRLKSRDSLSDKEIADRLRSQVPLSVKVGKATWLLKNDGTLAELKAATLDLLRKIQSGKE